MSEILEQKGLNFKSQERERAQKTESKRQSKRWNGREREIARERARERKGDQNNPIVICEHVRTGLPVKKQQKKKTMQGTGFTPTS